MHLDARGIIAIFEIIIYVPILCIGAFLSFRHGFGRTAGWIFLVILSVIRILGGVTHVLSESSSSSTSDKTIYTVMESAGLAPLFGATVGFLLTVSQHSLDSRPLLTRALTLLGLLSSVGLILSIFGGVKDADAATQSALSDGQTLRHVGIALYIVVFAGALIATLFCWSNRDAVLKYRRRLLKGVIVTLPFLTVRLVYGVLSVFAPLPFGFDSNGNEILITSTSPIAKFASGTGSWGIYLVMSVIVEYIAVLIYVVVGIITPLNKDLPDYNKGGAWSPEDAPVNQEAYGMQRASAPSYAQGGAPSYAQGGAPSSAQGGAPSYAHGFMSRE